MKHIWTYITGVVFNFIIFPLMSFASEVTELIPRQNGTNLSNLPNGDIATHWIPRIIDIILKLGFTITTAMIVYAGILYIMAQGEEGDADKAKDILIYGITGFIIISISYAVVQGIISFDFFKN